jgi:hypothetical protein
METIRIGHMIGPPALKFRMKKFEVCVGSDGAALASGVTVAVTVGGVTAAGEVPAVAGAVPGAGGTTGATVVPGATATEAPGAASAGARERPGEAASAGDSAGIAGLVPEGAAGLCAKPVSATVREQRLTISVFFIFSRVDGGQKIPRLVFPLFIPKEITARPAKLF